MAGMSQEKTEFWEFVLSEHGVSGLSVREFCRREGVSEPSFYQWRKKLVARQEGSSEQGSGAGLDFLPITVVDAMDDCAQAVASVDTQSGIELDAQIVTPSGYQVQLSNSAQANLILQSLVAIERVSQGDV